MEENKENPFWGSVDEESTADDDTFSFCHFSMLDNNEDTLTGGDDGDGLVVVQSPRTSFEFEFINPQTELIFTNPDIHFYRPDPVSPKTVKSVSLANGIDSSLSKDRSDSISLLRSLKDYTVVISQVQKVNITTLTAMSAKSRRRMFMFGPVKFKPEMELSAIKERQSRRRGPNVMFSSAVVEGGETVDIGGSSRRKRNMWKMIKALKGRAYFSNVFTKSCSCLPLSPVGVRKFREVAD